MPDVCTSPESGGTVVKQLTLYDIQTTGAPYQSSSSTSIEAAVAAGPKVGTQKYVILQILAYQGEYGATEDEIEVALGMLRSAVCGRINALVKEGKVRDSGRVRLSRWGRNCIVWVIGPAAGGLGNDRG